MGTNEPEGGKGAASFKGKGRTRSMQCESRSSREAFCCGLRRVYGRLESTIPSRFPFIGSEVFSLLASSTRDLQYGRQFGTGDPATRNALLVLGASGEWIFAVVRRLQPRRSTCWGPTMNVPPAMSTSSTGAVPTSNNDDTPALDVPMVATPPDNPLSLSPSPEVSVRSSIPPTSLALVRPLTGTQSLANLRRGVFQTVIFLDHVLRAI